MFLPIVIDTVYANTLHKAYLHIWCVDQESNCSSRLSLILLRNFNKYKNIR